MSARKRLLIVDDDYDMAGSIAELIDLTEDLTAEIVTTGKETLAYVQRERVDLMLLDVGLPDLDGREVCKLLRRRGFRSPVIMITGHDTAADTILGLEAGANDYVTKPFSLSVLVARIRTQLRQFEQSHDAVLTVGPYTFHPAARALICRDGRKIKLTEKETSLLRFLVHAEGRVVSRNVLMSEVWGHNANASTHTLETHVYRLRQKLAWGSDRARLLVRESGGYRILFE